jgi:hypothetical protein
MLLIVMIGISYLIYAKVWEIKSLVHEQVVASKKGNPVQNAWVPSSRPALCHFPLDKALLDV